MNHRPISKINGLNWVHTLGGQNSDNPDDKTGFTQKLEGYQGAVLPNRRIASGNALADQPPHTCVDLVW